MPDNSSRPDLSKLSQEQQFLLRDLFQHPGWEVCQSWLEDQWHSCHRALASKTEPVEIYRLQGEISAFGRLNGLRDLLLPKPIRRPV